MSNNTQSSQGTAQSNPFGSIGQSVDEIGHKIRVTLMILGIIGIALGAAILVWPGQSLLVGVYILAAFFVVAGAVRIGISLFGEGITIGYRVLGIVLGLLLIAAGVLSFQTPTGAVWAIGLVIGIAWIVQGIMAFVEAGKFGIGVGWSIFFGIISIIGGIAVLSIPQDSVQILWIFNAVLLLITGVVEVIRSIAGHFEAKKIKEEPQKIQEQYQQDLQQAEQKAQQSAQQFRDDVQGYEQNITGRGNQSGQSQSGQGQSGQGQSSSQ